jgi:hypothetical protein
MAKDVKAIAGPADEAGKVEPETTTQESQPEDQTAGAGTTVTEAPVREVVSETGTPQAPLAKTIPIERFSQVNRKYKELQRELAELRSRSQLAQYDPNDYEATMSSPIVQELLIKVAKQELTDYAREILETQYPNFDPRLKKAILSNVRGFVKEATTDIESAKIDILEYIEEVAEEKAEEGQSPQGKTFPVAATNAGETALTARPADVQKILAKPVDSWTDDEVKLVEEYSKSQKGGR